VVVFALKLLEAYPDAQYYEHVKACLEDKNLLVQKQASRCLGKMDTWMKQQKN
jgi:hypothetical protein